MKLKNFETGLQRAYYVAWGLVAPVMAVFIAYEFFDNLDRRTPEQVLQYTGALLGFVLGPAVLMYAARWIYRGFVPKPSE